MDATCSKMPVPSSPDSTASAASSRLCSTAVTVIPAAGAFTLTPRICGCPSGSSPSTFSNALPRLLTSHVVFTSVCTAKLASLSWIWMTTVSGSERTIPRTSSTYGSAARMLPAVVALFTSSRLSPGSMPDAAITSSAE